MHQREGIGAGGSFLLTERTSGKNGRITMISVVGIGPGDKKYLTPMARLRIDEAELLLGGKRILELFPEAKAEKILFSWEMNLREICKRSEKVVVLASGDPLLFGVLDWVLQNLPSEEVEVISGISTVQYMLSKLRIPLKDVVVTSLHGRDGQIFPLVLTHRTVVVFTDTRNTPVTIARALWGRGLGECMVWVGENLSLESESIQGFRAEELAQKEDQFSLNLVVIQRCIPSCLEFPTGSSNVVLFL